MSLPSFKPAWHSPAPRKPQAQTPERKARSSYAWQQVRAAHLAKHPLCASCLRKGINRAATDVDHIRPLADGGSLTDPANLQSLCKWHHIAKTNKENRERRQKKQKHK